MLFQQTHIRHRIALGKQVFMNKKKLFTGNLSIQLKKRIVKSVLCSVVLYAAESYWGRTVSHNSTVALLPTLTLTTVIHYQNTSVTITDTHTIYSVHWAMWTFITFCVSCRWRKMHCGHAHLCVCMSVCVCVCPRSHAHTTARTPM